MKNVLVFGGAGQLGTCLQQLRPKELNGYQYHYLDVEEGNILDPQVLSSLFVKYQPSYVINCAAYTAVDLAEDEVEKADAINHLGAANVALACKEAGTVLIHVSTDFVFEGNHAHPLKENDSAHPINVYGSTKLAGEHEIKRILDQHFIIRTSWLYSEFGGNFVKTMIKLGQSRDQLSVIGDQVGSPTYAMDLADFIIFLIDQGKTDYGIYHFSNEGVASWYDFAHEIFDLYGIQIALNSIATEEYPTKAKRPSYSVMNKSKVKKGLQYSIPHWKDSLKVCINRLKKNQ